MGLGGSDCPVPFRLSDLIWRYDLDLTDGVREGGEAHCGVRVSMRCVQSVDVGDASVAFRARGTVDGAQEITVSSNA
jgi:hypothetical protein